MDAVGQQLAPPALGASDFVALGVGPAATLLIALIFSILIAWNLIKLFIEIVERYLLVGVLAYTSPIFLSIFVLNFDVPGLFEVYRDVRWAMCDDDGIRSIHKSHLLYIFCL